MNINGNSKDSNYRYKRPDFDVKNGGGGNGIYTTFNNMDMIGKSINHPASILFKYFAKVTGSNYIEAKNQLTGTHTKQSLNIILQEYIENFIICPKCNIPETIPKLVGNKKRAELFLACNACNNESPVISTKKNVERGIDIIIKYLQAGNEWKIPKGQIRKIELPNNIVSDTTTIIDNTVEEYVPFDDI
jgi:translation initiation factor 2 beta subunit (eIF-2beta)/eIF-5